MLGGRAWQHIFLACSKLGSMAIYVVKQACGNEIMPSFSVHSRLLVKSLVCHNSDFKTALVHVVIEY